jgi:protoporphyrinogen oxidase
MIGIGVAGLTAVYGFIRPVLYERNRRLTGLADRVEIAPAPGDRGVEALRLSYTLRF